MILQGIFCRAKLRSIWLQLFHGEFIVAVCDRGIHGDQISHGKRGMFLRFSMHVLVIKHGTDLLTVTGKMKLDHNLYLIIGAGKLLHTLEDTAYHAAQAVGGLLFVDIFDHKIQDLAGVIKILF